MKTDLRDFIIIKLHTLSALWDVVSHKNSYDTTKIGNGNIPPPTVTRSGPGPSAAHLPCRSKAQELRAGLSSNSLRFLTPVRANGLIALGSEWAGSPDRVTVGGFAVDIYPVPNPQYILS